MMPISYKGFGDSTATDDNITPMASLVPLESVLSNRNVKISKNRQGNVNPIDLSKIKLNNKQQCKNNLVSEQSRLTNPANFYRDIEINRFYNLINDPQVNIFTDFAENSRLTATDNYVPQIPTLMHDECSNTPQNFTGCKFN